jgi:hypothetical protein
MVGESFVAIQGIEISDLRIVVERQQERHPGVIGVTKRCVNRLTGLTYLTHLSNPKGCKESSRWSESSETTGNAILIGSHPGGVPHPSR